MICKIISAAWLVPVSRCVSLDIGNPFVKKETRAQSMLFAKLLLGRRGDAIVAW